MRSVQMAYLFLSGVNIKKHTSEYFCTPVKLINTQDGINMLVSNEKVHSDVRNFSGKSINIFPHSSKRKLKKYKSWYLAVFNLSDKGHTHYIKYRTRANITRGLYTFLPTF